MIKVTYTTYEETGYYFDYEFGNYLPVEEEVEHSVIVADIEEFCRDYDYVELVEVKEIPNDIVIQTMKFVSSDIERIAHEFSVGNIDIKKALVLLQNKTGNNHIHTMRYLRGTEERDCTVIDFGCPVQASVVIYR